MNVTDLCNMVSNCNGHSVALGAHASMRNQMNDNAHAKPGMRVSRALLYHNANLVVCEINADLTYDILAALKPVQTDHAHAKIQDTMPNRPQVLPKHCQQCHQESRRRTP